MPKMGYQYQEVLCARAQYTMWSAPAVCKPVRAITTEEVQAVVGCALTHTELNYREMNCRMINENEAFLSPSDVYRILKKNSLLVRRGNKEKLA